MNDSFSINSGDSYFSQIQSRYETFSASQKRIADYLQKHPEDMFNCSITVLARKIGTSPAAITRFCQALHYQGFSDMRFCMEKFLYEPALTDDAKIRYADSVDTIKKKLLRAQTGCITNTLLQLSDHSVARLAGLICKARMVHIYGDGGPGASANYAYQLFLQIGVPCNYFTDIRLALLAVSQLQRGDVAIGITYSGASASILEAITAAKQRKAATAVITGYANSPLAKLASVPVCYSAGVEDDLRYLHVARMCELSILGLLQSAILNLMTDDMRKNLLPTKRSIESSRKG